MPVATRTFRVFVSSTFEDLKEERDALQRDVFPKLRALCEQHGARFQAIDLRWGVRDEAALDQQTVEICLREIRRCQATGVKPNFVVLLGDRYGWQPLPAQIPAAEFDTLRPHLPTLAAQWYWLDENAVPSEYCLRPRTGTFVDPATWSRVEQTLREALAKAARAVGLPEKELIKYEASATHQEILAGMGETEADRQHVFAFVRPSSGNTDPRVEELKSHLRVHDFDPVAVYDQLRQVIIAEIKRFEDKPALDLEIQAHDRFAEDRCRIFVGRHAVSKTISDYIAGPERRPLVLHGESGSGKSAVMAKASQQYHGPGRVIRRFIGVSPESVSGHALLTSLCRQLVPGETPVDYAQLENAFRERLSAAAAEQPLVLFIDALDQLAAGDPARDVTWLPSELPPHVKVIVSTTDVGERLPDGVPVRLERMAQSEGDQALTELLTEAHRTLQPWQRDKVLAHFDRCGLPLYLKLAAEESRLWVSYAPEDSCTLGEGVAGVLDTLFDRLASNANHGPVLVERSLGYLAAARYGLTEGEVLDVLTADDAVWNDFDKRKHHEVSERRLPVVVWSRLSMDLEPYLTERAAPGGTVIAFYHRQLAERVAGRFLSGNESQRHHKKLADYFAGLSEWLDVNKKIPNLRRAVEMVRHQLSAQMLDVAVANLTDLDFISAKCCGGLVSDLQEDYREANAGLPEAHAAVRDEVRQRAEAARWTKEIIEYSRQWTAGGGSRLMPEVIRSVRIRSKEEIKTASRQVADHPTRLDRLRSFASFVTLEQHSLTVYGERPGFTMQQALNSALDGPVAAAAWAHIGNDRNVVKLLRAEYSRPRWASSPACICHVTSADLGPSALSADGSLAVSGGEGGSVLLWDMRSGTRLGSFDSPLNMVTAIALSADGSFAAAGDGVGVVAVWALKTRKLITVQKGAGVVNALCLSADGNVVVSAHQSGAINRWHIGDREPHHTLHTQSGPLYALALSADGRLVVSGGEDTLLRIHSFETGLNTMLRGHLRRVTAVAMSACGDHIFSASDDRTLRMWDVQSAICARTMEAQVVPGSAALAISADGRLGVSAEGQGGFNVDEPWQHAVRIWNLDTGECVRTFPGHSFWIRSVGMSADGGKVLSASGDETMRLWDTELLFDESVMEAHASSVRSVAVTAGGKVAVTGGMDATIRVWDVVTGECLRKLGRLDGWGWVDYLVADDEGRFANSLTENGVFAVIDLTAYTPAREMQVPLGHAKSLALSPDGRRAVTGSMLGHSTLRIWNAPQAVCIREVDAGELDWTAFTPDGREIIASGLSRVSIWDSATYDQIRSFTRPMAAAMAVTADGRLLLCAGYTTPYLHILDIKTGKTLRRVEIPNARVEGFCITRDCRHVVLRCDDGALRLYALQSNQIRYTMDGSGVRAGTRPDLRHGRFLEVNTTDDGRYIVASMTSGLGVWDLPSGRNIAFVPHSARLECLTVVQDRIVVGDVGGNLLFLKCDNLKLGPATSTGVRLWQHESNLQESMHSKGTGHWDTDVTFACGWCSHRSAVPRRALDALRSVAGAFIRDDPPPLLAIADGAWDEPQLVSVCPRCRGQIRFNPIIVDNMHRH